MKMYKKAQSQIITTVLIILLVLAAIVIVWQVVNSTIKDGADQVEKQSTCLGISMEVTAVDQDTVVVKRIGGESLTGTSVVYIEGRSTATYPGSKAFGEPMDSERIDTALKTGGVEVEVALKLEDGTVCPISGKATTNPNPDCDPTDGSAVSVDAPCNCGVDASDDVVVCEVTKSCTITGDPAIGTCS